MIEDDGSILVVSDTVHPYYVLRTLYREIGGVCSSPPAPTSITPFVSDVMTAGRFKQAHALLTCTRRTGILTVGLEGDFQTPSSFF